jgi:molecular chaperone GrpE
MNKPTNLDDKRAASPDVTDEATDGTAASPADPERGEADLQTQIANLTDQLLRQQAEMANFRRRTERDRDDQIAGARRHLLRDLLPVLDDFERALGAETDNLDAYRAGVELILKSLHEFLVAVGVERIDPHGEPFDPHLHQAVDHSETDAVPEHHVANVYQPGYSHGGQLLRPAMVGVARPPTATPDQDKN